MSVFFSRVINDIHQHNRKLGFPCCLNCFFHTFDKKSNIDLDILSICLDNLQLDGETNKQTKIALLVQKVIFEILKFLELGKLFFVLWCVCFLGMKLWSMNQVFFFVCFFFLKMKLWSMYESSSLYSDHLGCHENHSDFQFGDLWPLFLKLSSYHGNPRVHPQCQPPPRK